MRPRLQTYQKEYYTERIPMSVPPSIRRTSSNEKPDINTLINSPTKLHLYSILLSQQSADLRNRYGTNKMKTFNPESEDRVLHNELFSSNGKRHIAGLGNIDIIVSDRFNIFPTHMDYPVSTVLNTKSKDIDAKSETLLFDQILRNKYENYTERFNKDNHGRQTPPKEEFLTMANRSEVLINPVVDFPKNPTRSLLREDFQKKKKLDTKIKPKHERSFVEFKNHVFSNFNTIRSPQPKHSNETCSTFGSSNTNNKNRVAESEKDPHPGYRSLRVMYSRSFVQRH